MGNLSFGKVLDVRIAGFTAINSTQRVKLGDYSGATAGTATVGANPLRGTLYWDDCMYVITKASVAGGATGGSYTITIETDALSGALGYTGLPIASVTIGPNSTATGGIVIDNTHNSKGSPVPTHIQVTQGATGVCTFDVHAIAKQYRGVLGTAGNKTSERILSGSIMKSVPNLTTAMTYYIGTTDTDLGMGRMRLWDSAMFWAVAGSTITGTWDVDLIGKVGGVTTTLASTGTAGTLTTIGDKKVLANNFYGQCANPVQLIVTEVGAGGIAGLDVVGIAKSGRGSMAKS